MEYILQRWKYSNDENKEERIYVDIKNNNYHHKIMLDEEAIKLYQNSDGMPLTLEQIKGMKYLNEIPVLEKQ